MIEQILPGDAPVAEKQHYGERVIEFGGEEEHGG
jgi:hypothetical protein